MGVRYGNGCITLQARGRNSRITIGKDCKLSNNTSIIAIQSVEIGNDCLIGELVSIMDSDFHAINPNKRHSGRIKTAPVKLEDNVWLGSRVMVLKGVTIGENSVVAAGAVVTKSVPANCVAAGVPAKVLECIS
jgi:maltose O-acetyltransferase